ncbi:hypothetical protein QFC21_001583 [Naganishia friedmannii]|uniref:Uncharacterized protein n=1 Tax=Naganishia friedmannii TaxID=89922 RepID=A0ACC2W5R6_9TREE|nr:hypothetical protein QFC21_001583 [Naganishia friedmannii]
MALRTTCASLVATTAQAGVLRRTATGQRWIRQAVGSARGTSHGDSHVAHARTLATSSSAAVLDPLYTPDYPAHLPIPQSTLAALLARLGLPSTPQMQAALLVALTDVSYDPSKLPRSIYAPLEDASTASSIATAATVTENNTLLAALGNSLLGLFASEHLSTTYPNLPTRPLKALTSRYVGPAACFAIAKDLGLGVSDGAYVSDGALRGAVEGQGNAGRSRKRSSPSLGVPVRWVRAERDGPEDVVDAAAATEDGDARSEMTQGQGKRRTTWEEVVARSVRSFVGLVYQEKGITAARQFVHAHFLSRHVDVTSLINVRAPKHVLSVEVRKLLGQAGAPELAGVESRILAESGRYSLSPIFNIGLFLPSGLKLAEGYGSSLRMAEHRAAINALTAMYCARGELLVRDAESTQGGNVNNVGMDLPTSAYAPPGPTSTTPEGGVESLLRVDREKESQFKGNIMLSRAEALMASGKGSASKSRTTRR